nr:unnamed protein product [Spirometra erinaceieuropaei]
MNASSAVTLAPARLCPSPEARSAGRAGDNGDPACRWVDQPSPRHPKVAYSPTASQETSSLNNDLEQGLLTGNKCGLCRYLAATDIIFATRQLQEKCQEMQTHV